MLVEGVGHPDLVLEVESTLPSVAGSIVCNPLMHGRFYRQGEEGGGAGGSVIKTSDI